MYELIDRMMKLRILGQIYVEAIVYLLISRLLESDCLVDCQKIGFLVVARPNSTLLANSLVSLPKKKNSTFNFKKNVLS